MLQQLIIGVALVLGTQTVASVLGWTVLRGTVGRPGPRVAAMTGIVIVYHVALFDIVSQQQVLLFGVGFVLHHLGFVCRWLSATWFHRTGDAAPKLGFFLFMMVPATRQYYGGARFEDLEWRRFDAALLREYMLHLLYSVSVIAVAVVAIQAVLGADAVSSPVKHVLFNTAVFVAGVEGLGVLGNTESLFLSLFGRHYKFFGNFTWINSRHIGEFWRNWNQHAIMFFREVSIALGLQRRFFVNVLAVFAISGGLHQILVWYYTRTFGYLTFVSFLLHGLGVAVFTLAYRKSKGWPSAARWLAFNPLTSLAVSAAASFPFIEEILGAASAAPW